jgi:hypothetical protein
MNETQNITQIEEDARTVRLEQQALFRQVINNLRAKHRKTFAGLLMAAAAVVVIWALFACPWLHRMALCPLFPK